MKKLTITALLAGQIAAAAQPAFAADFPSAQEQRAGAFAGFALRMPLDGPQRRQIRAGLRLAPMLETRGTRGETRLRIGEGLEFGTRAGRPLSFSLAGQDLRGRRFGAAQANDDDNDGLSTGEILLIAGGVIVVTAGVVAVVLIDAIDDNSE